MAKIFVIAGHGAGDPGACGNGYQEAERVRALAKRIKALGGDNVKLGEMNRNYYADNGISSLTISKDYQIIELHMDSASASARGGHVVIKAGLNPDKYDKALASFIGNILPGRSQLIVKRDNLANPYRASAKGYSYRLVECGFISNATDVKIFNTKMDEIATGILKAFDIVTKKDNSTDKSTTSTSSNTAQSEQVYRIRKSWADEKSQIGAYKNLESAKTVCAKNPGYSVFDKSGKAVYSASTTTSSNKTTSTNSKAGDVFYQVYANGKWWSYIKNYGSGSNGYAGVTGYPMKALRAYVEGQAKEVGYLEYRVHKVGGTWYPWQRDLNKDSNGENFAGDLKNNFDGLQMRVVGVTGRHVKYRVHVIGKGWLDWITDYGDGSNGYAGWYGYAIDAVQVDVV